VPQEDFRHARPMPPTQSKPPQGECPIEASAYQRGQP